MTLQEAQAELTYLRGLASSGNDLANYKERIARLYEVVCRKTLRQCNCKDVLPDALIEIYRKLKHYKTNMSEFKSKARLVAGVVLQWENNHYTNANLTDEVARAFLAAYPMREDWFAILPAAEKATAESAETVSAEVKAESKPVATPKKKSSKKRK